MADLRQEYHEKKPNGTQSYTQDIQNALDDLLGESYDAANETSLKNPFLKACFNRIAPNQSWEELVKTHENYDASWETKTKKKLATALRMLLTEQIGWPEDKGIPGFKRKYLAAILIAIKASDQGISRTEEHVQITLDPEFDHQLLSEEVPERTCPELDFPTLLTFSNTIKSDATAFLEKREIDPTSNNHHVVYVIDCAPDPNNEGSRITSIRQDAQAKSKTGASLSEREAAAEFLNESKGILYVGYSHEFPKRMARHHHGKSSGSANFLNLYKPKRLLELTEYSSEDEARRRERMRADELRRQTDCYVYQQ